MNTMPSTTTALSLPAMMDVARTATGLEDFGDLDFVPRAERWLECVEREAGISAAGRAGLEAVITGWLVNRLRFTDDLARRPEILDEVVRGPIVIVGLPRTGTTKLLRILTRDRAVQGMTMWRVLNLAPMPGAQAGDPDPRVELATGYMRLVAQQNPDLLIGHPMDALEAEEEVFVLEQEFSSLFNAIRVRVPSFLREIIDSPAREPYPYLKRILQYTQWQRREAGARLWVLKAPIHMGTLPKLLQVFPDATIVHCYRDPVVSVPSTCRVIELFRSLFADEIDLQALGQEQLDVWSRLQQEHLRARQDAAVDARIVDVHYEDICDDVLAVAGAIYQRFGRELDVATEQRMREWEAEHPQHQFGRHQYSLERYGLTAEGVVSACSPYIRRFDKEAAR